MQLHFLQADIANSRKAAPAVADITRVSDVVLLDCGREFSLADEKIHTLQHRNFHFSSADYLSSFENSVRSRSGATRSYLALDAREGQAKRGGRQGKEK
jgi:hypothetical protein